MVLVVDNMRKNKFSWFRHIMSRNEWETVKAEIQIDVEKWRKRERPDNKWLLDVVKRVIRIRLVLHKWSW